MNEELYKFFWDNSIELALIFDKNGKLTDANRKARTILEFSEDADITMFEIFKTDIYLEDDEIKIPKDMYEGNYEINAYRKNNTCFPTKSIVYHLQDKYIVICYDSTSQRLLEQENARAKEEILSASKMKAEFVANVTHELRTPVNGIEGNAKELEGIEDDKKKLRLLSLIRQGCTNMNAIINNILDFSKLDAGKLKLENREFVFRDMIDYVKANHVNKITEKGLDFIVNISPEIPEKIIGDELRIGQILNNFLSNACKFTSIGKIMLEVAKTSQIENKMELFFLVVDTGIGIDKADQDKLFKSFSQVDASITRNYGGTGLGLNISKQLIEQMGGTVNLQSEIGKGSTFSFNIWVEVKESDIRDGAVNENADEIMKKLASLSANDKDEKIWEYGTDENLSEINKKISKLMLCIDMGNWDKAESFMETIRMLTKDAEKDIKTTVLKLKMAVQKEDYDKSIAAVETLKEIVDK